MISATETSSRGHLVQMLGAGNIWEDLSSAPNNAKSIAVNMIGYVWMSDQNGQVYSHSGKSNWILQNGDANDISISKTGAVWILNAYGQAS